MRVISAKKLLFVLTETDGVFEMSVTLYTQVEPVFMIYDCPPYVNDEVF